MTKHVERAVCAIRTHKYSKPRRYRYTDPKLSYHNRVYTDHGAVIISQETQMVEMTIDMAALMDWMGRRAMAAKSGVSKLQDGMIVARVVGQRTVTVVEEKEIPLDKGTELVA